MRALVLFASTLITSQAFADDTFLAGLGAQTCSFLNANIQPGDGWAKNTLTMGVMSWAQGFVSGSNATMKEIRNKYFDLGTVSRDEQWAFILESCRRKPTQDISHAVYEMMFARLRIRPVNH
jgi:hypothetical protein